ncbi:lysophosphatidic acid receptor 6-like isoform X1 [Protopterus annectens]|uniref:lysophosphatidic acid receptor 6-like isoform X1 n=1 Tax=Protopterus annectens TaxID=7888 RepID=UPI001CFA7695|nr:lysophosphatidic acid receptor 6-like isoform X1 [Protopterus annectens]
MDLQSNTTSEYKTFFVGANSLIFVLGLFLNVLALVIFFRYHKFRSPTTVYMKNLAISDLLLVAFLPVRIYYYGTNAHLDDTLCEITGLILLVNMYGSIFLLTCISGDRCMAVCFPMNSCVKSIRDNAKYICLGVWMLTVGASIPVYAFPKLKNNGSKTGKCFESEPVYVTKQAPVVVSLMIGFFIPLTVMSACSWALLRAVRRSSAAQMQHMRPHKIRSMIVANITIFLICFLPYNTVLLLYITTTSQTDYLHFAYRCALLVACVNTILDPIFYYFATESFMESVTWKKIWGSNSDEEGGKSLQNLT